MRDNITMTLAFIAFVGVSIFGINHIFNAPCPMTGLNQILWFWAHLSFFGTLAVLSAGIVGLGIYLLTSPIE